jgi:hypothetical protein
VSDSSLLSVSPPSVSPPSVSPPSVSPLPVSPLFVVVSSSLSTSIVAEALRALALSPTVIFGRSWIESSESCEPLGLRAKPTFLKVLIIVSLCSKCSLSHAFATYCVKSIQQSPTKYFPAFHSSKCSSA